MKKAHTAAPFGSTPRSSPVHPSFTLLSFALLGTVPFIFQDPRVLIFLLVINLIIVTRLGWTNALKKAYLVVGGVGGLFTCITWLPFIREGYAYWQSHIPLINYPVQVTDVGILWALGMGLRIANVSLLSMYVLLSTSPRQMAIALRGIGIPFSVGFLISLIFRFIPLVKQDLHNVREAQMVRGLQIGRGSIAEKARNYSYLLVPLIFTSLKRVQLIANALDSRGFQLRNRNHRFYRMPIWRRKEQVILLFGFCLVGLLVYLARIHSAQVGILLPYRI